MKAPCDEPFTTEADAIADDCRPEPEVDENVNDSELGDLNLTDEQEDAIVAFLKTLSDGHPGGAAPADQQRAMPRRGHNGAMRRGPGP